MLHIATEPDDNDLEDDSPIRLAIFNIVILSTTLPPTHVLPPLLEQFPKLATSANPYERRGAMSALGAVMEGAPDFMADYIEELLPFVFKSLRDPEPAVIRVTLVALGQITDQLPTEVTKHHVTMVPVVFELLGSNNLEIVKAACSSLDAILEWVPKEAVEQYLPKLMEALLYIMTTNVDVDVKIIVAGIFPLSDNDNGSGDWNSGTCFKGRILRIPRLLNAYLLQHERSHWIRPRRPPRLRHRHPRHHRLRGRKAEIPPLYGQILPPRPRRPQNERIPSP